MSVLRMLTVLLATFAAQAALGLLWPTADRYVDLMLIPVIWSGIGGSQRGAMLVGCAAGLLQDAWFRVGIFGLNGFKKTLLGWILGGLGARFDLNRQGGRLLIGSVASLADSLLDFALRGMIGQKHLTFPLIDTVIKALVTGVLIAGLFGVTDRVRRRRALRFTG